MFPVHQVWPKPSCKAQWKGEEDKADKGRGGKTTSGNGQAWSSASPRGQWRTGKNGENWLQNHLWCPNDRLRDGHYLLRCMVSEYSLWAHGAFLKTLSRSNLAWIVEVKDFRFSLSRYWCETSEIQVTWSNWWMWMTRRITHGTKFHNKSLACPPPPLVHLRWE